MHGKLPQCSLGYFVKCWHGILQIYCLLAYWMINATLWPNLYIFPYGIQIQPSSVPVHAANPCIVLEAEEKKQARRKENLLRYSAPRRKIHFDLTGTVMSPLFLKTMKRVTWTGMLKSLCFYKKPTPELLISAMAQMNKTKSSQPKEQCLKL